MLTGLGLDNYDKITVLPVFIPFHLRLQTVENIFNSCRLAASVLLSR